MPILPPPDYSPVFPFTSGHLQTLYPTLLRRTPPATPKRQRIETDDGDFLDLDWHYCNENRPADRLTVISHGLEGSSRRKNVLGMAQALKKAGWDVLCYNFRGCSEEMNRLPRLYHSGVTDDLHRVLCHGLEKGGYTIAALVGFSMGGNQTLKYLGENPSHVPEQVKAAAVFSVPIQLADAAREMALPANRIYTEYFLRGLRDKVRRKSERFPDLFPTEGLEDLKTFFEFDDIYTGPLHGFAGAADYYAKSSADQFLDAIEVPALLVQAENDPFLPRSCYPEEKARNSDALFLEIPSDGGHVGFLESFLKGSYWSESRAAQFFAEAVNLPVNSIAEHAPASF